MKDLSLCFGSGDGVGVRKVHGEMIEQVCCALELVKKWVSYSDRCFAFSPCSLLGLHPLNNKSEKGVTPKNSLFPGQPNMTVPV
jgi:hypothetical protein